MIKKQQKQPQNDKMKGLWESWISTGKIAPEQKYFGILNKKAFSIILISTLLLSILANIGIYFFLYS